MEGRGFWGLLQSGIRLELSSANFQLMYGPLGTAASWHKSEQHKKKSKQNEVFSLSLLCSVDFDAGDNVDKIHKFPWLLHKICFSYQLHISVTLSSNP